MGQSDRFNRPFASVHPLSNLSDELRHVIEEVEALAVEPSPFASIMLH